LRGGEPGTQMCMQGVPVGETGQRVVLRQVPYSFRFTLANRNIPQHRAIRKPVAPLPTEETGFQPERLAVLPAARELHHLAARHLEGFVRQVENRECGRLAGMVASALAGGIDPLERL